MTSSHLESKILDLEARLRAENEQNMNDSSSSELSSGFGSRPGSGRRPIRLIGSSGTPTRLRKQYDFPGSNCQSTSVDSSEMVAKMKEITKMSGIITINGKSYVTGINDLEKRGDLGSGTCGHVVQMLHRPSNSVIAVKQMRWSGDSEENKRIHMDLEVVLKCDNPYIVSCYGCFINDADVWICMELMSTSFDKLSKLFGGPLPEDIIGMVALGTVRALHYLKMRHERMHRDIKPSNILLDSQGNVKLCDFGISGRLVNSKAKSGNAGCAAYMAPERISPGTTGQRDYDVRADVWSLGISLVELATGTFPYQGCKSEFEILSRILHDDPPKLPNNNNFSPEFHSFIEAWILPDTIISGGSTSHNVHEKTAEGSGKLRTILQRSNVLQLSLRKDYHQRPKYNKLLEHPFLQRYSSKNVDVAAWFAQVQSSTSKTVSQLQKSNVDSNKKQDHSVLRKKETKTKNESDGLKSIWNSIMRSPLFHRRKKSLETPPTLLMPSSPPANVITPSPPTSPSLCMSPQVAGNTSPLVLQRFIHQQMQHTNGSRRQNRSSSISPTLRQFDTLAQELKNLRIDSTPVRRNTSPSPEPPPRINKMVSPLLLRRMAYNNVPESYSFNQSHGFQRYGIPPQPPPRKKNAESKSVPCSPIPNHRYFKSPPWYPLDRS